MNLDRIAIEPRCRSSWEAIDLGFRMAREWWRPMFFWWLLPALCCYLIFSLVFYQTPWLVALLLWWLKPLFDRFPLFVASRKLFDENLPVPQQLAAMRKILFRDLLPWLLWRRLNVTRSMDLPVTLLENLRGEKRARRLQVLHYRSGNAATWLTVVCLHLEVVVSFGFLGLLIWMVPEQANVNWLDLFDFEALWHEHLLNAFTALAMALVAPFYVLAGFALYVSRRVELEGWDIEIRFRQLAERLSSEKKVPRAMGVQSLLVFALALLFSFSQPEDVRAQELAGEQVHEREFSALLAEQVLSGDDFQRKKTITKWRFKNSEDMQEDEVPDWWITLVEWLEKFSASTQGLRGNISSFAFWLELLLWFSLAGIILYFMVRYRHLLRRLVAHRREDDQTAAPPAELFGMDVRRESLPESVPQVVMDLWDQQQHRDALGLLFRALLSRLMHDHAFRFKDGFTERECVELVEQSGQQQLARYANAIVICWQGLAYAHVVPDREVVRGFCEQWPGVLPDA